MSISAEDPRLAWLMLHDPHQDRRGSIEPANTALAASISDQFAASVAAAARAVMSTAVAVGGITSVNASSLIVGADAAHALELDHAVVAAQRQSFDTLVAAFKQSPLTGSTSVMDLALSDSGWNPLDPRQASNHDGFARYVSILAANPFFDPPQFVRNSLDLRNYRDPPALVAGIAALLPDITEADKRRIVKAILDMTHSVFDGGGDSRSAQATLFVQHAVAVNAGRITVNLYWCQALMRYERHSNKTSVSVELQSVFNVERVSLSFPTVNWPQYAEAVARRNVTDVQRWLQRTASTG